MDEFELFSGTEDVLLLQYSCHASPWQLRACIGHGDKTTGVGSCLPVEVFFLLRPVSQIQHDPDFYTNNTMTTFLPLSKGEKKKH